jgi:hypothetical protein
MESNEAHPSGPRGSEWLARERYWKNKLGRIRLGAEPVEQQLDKYRRVTWMLSVLPLGLGLFIVALFTAFRRPDVGVILAAILFVPVVSIAWLDFVRLRARVRAYLRELQEHQARQETSGRA